MSLQLSDIVFVHTRYNSDVKTSNHIDYLKHLPEEGPCRTGEGELLAHDTPVEDVTEDVVPEKAVLYIRACEFLDIHGLHFVCLRFCEQRGLFLSNCSLWNVLSGRIFPPLSCSGSYYSVRHCMQLNYHSSIIIMYCEQN